MKHLPSQTRTRNRVAALALAVFLTLAACSPTSSGPPVLIFHNRSDVPIALYPDVTVAPCSSVELDQRSIDLANDRLLSAGSDWVPAGALRPGWGIQGQQIGSDQPVTVIVSGIMQPRFVDGRVPSSDLPACGGEPVGLG